MSEIYSVFYIVRPRANLWSALNKIKQATVMTILFEHSQNLPFIEGYLSHIRNIEIVPRRNL